MASASSSSSASSNSASGGKQIQSGFVDFQPHPAARLHLYADREEEMDLTFGSHRFLFGAEGTYRFLAQNFSGPSAKDPESSGSPASFTDSTGERGSSSSCFKPAESGELADLFERITFGSSEEIDLSQVDDLENVANSGSISNTNFTASKEVFADLYDGVT